MKNNVYAKFINIIKKSDSVVISFTETHAYITNSYILAKVTHSQYKGYFYGESTLFPEIKIGKTLMKRGKSEKILKEQEHFTDMERLISKDYKYVTECSNIVLRNCGDVDLAICFTDEGAMGLDRTYIEAAESICGKQFRFNGTLKPVIYGNDDTHIILVLPVRMSEGAKSELKALATLTKGE